MMNVRLIAVIIASLATSTSGMAGNVPVGATTGVTIPSQNSQSSSQSSSTQTSTSSGSSRYSGLLYNYPFSTDSDGQWSGIKPDSGMSFRVDFGELSTVLTTNNSVRHRMVMQPNVFREAEGLLTHAHQRVIQGGKLYVSIRCNGPALSYGGIRSYDIALIFGTIDDLRQQGAGKCMIENIEIQ